MRCPYPGEARITARRRRCSRSRRVTTVSGSGCSSPSCSSARPSSARGLAFRQNSGSSASTTAAPVKAIVPGVVGLQIRAALARLHVQGLRANVVAVPSSEPSGRVVAQHPKAGVATADGSSVRLNVSTMPSNSGTADLATKPPASLAAGLTVPDVRGQKVNDARKELRRTGLVIDDRRVRNDDLPKNSVVSQSPAPGTAATPGDHVLVTVSSGGGKRHGGRHREANQRTRIEGKPSRRPLRRLRGRETWESD